VAPANPVHHLVTPTISTNPQALIYGGSTSVGFFAIQLAKMLGFKVATACSPRNFDLVKSYGADAAFDYRNADECVAGIRKVSGGGVDTAMGCISEGASQAIAMKCFKDKPSGQLNIILTPDAEVQKIRPDVAISSTLVYTTFGKVR
jgi:NADPH:quinone reductase-like Zn-dependent oxidoreductase